VPRCRRSAWLPYPGEVAALGFPLVGLDPDRHVDKVRAFPPGRADAFDDQQRAVSRDLDRTLTLALVPPGRAVGHRPPGTRRDEDAADQQVGPAEPGVPPGDVVGMHDGRSRHDILQPRRQRGLAAGTAPVHGQDHRTTMSAFTLTRTHHGGRDNRQTLRTPRPCFGLLMGKA
jgi:hypothetical protein